MALGRSGSGAALSCKKRKKLRSHTSIDCSPAEQVGATLGIDAATWRSLEITQTLRDGRRDGALLGVIDRTVTSMGARTLADWLRQAFDRRGVDQRSARCRGGIFTEAALCARQFVKNCAASMTFSGWSLG